MMICIGALALMNIALVAALLVQRCQMEKKRDRVVDELTTEQMLRNVESSVSHMIYEKKLYAKDMELAKLREALKASECKRKELCKRLKEREENHVSD